MNKHIKLLLLTILAVLALAAFYFLTGKDGQVMPSLINTGQAEMTDQELKDKIGQMIMIGFRGAEAPEESDIYKTIKDVKVGGVVLFDYDVPSNSYPRNISSPQQVKKLISDIQRYSETPLLVSVDAEGGNVNRLKQKYGFASVVSEQKMGQDKTSDTVRAESNKLAKELKDAGFNMNLAPVVDLNINPKNPIIGALGRSFSSNPDEVFNKAKVYISNHLMNNIITVAKHFPGQGSATEDSHKGATDISNTYREEELVPYQKLNQEGLLNAVMAAHVINKNIDENYPATMSPAFLEDILRKQIGFKGVIISDDMQMAAITENYGFEESIIKAVNAGCDIISVLNNSPNGYDGEIAHKVRDIIFNAVKDRIINKERIIESYDRIISLKKKFRIITPTAEEIKSERFELIGAADPLNFGDALNIANDASQRTAIRPAFLLAISQEEMNLEKFDMCYLTDLKTGEGMRLVDGKKMAKVMKPERDIQDFLKITKELGKNPLKTPITCPMSFGWGGAMGPLDFIPSTWMQYRSQIEAITAKSADPWDIQDAFLAAAIYLSESGAESKTKQGEWKAAMIYFSGSASSPYTWYAEDTLKISDKIQKDIEVIENHF